jgi:hypothetical protein
MQRIQVSITCALIFSVAVWSAAAQHPAVPARPAAAASAAPTLATPSSIAEEHTHLRHQLDAALAAGGKTAASAKAVAAVLLPHFQAEDAYAMPPLGLLQALANGQPLSAEQKREAIHMADQLRAHLAQMLHEHQQIHAALDNLAAAAREEHKPEALAFAETLMLHAQNEEQVLYPTTLLIGRYLHLEPNASH